MDLEEIARDVVRAHPLGWEADLLLLALQRSAGAASPGKVHEAVRHARAEAQAERDRLLLARLRRQQRPDDPGAAR
jgi:hypothetical protein